MSDDEPITLDIELTDIIEEALDEPFTVPRFVLDPFISGCAGYRMYISDGEANRCYIQALLPVTYTYPAVAGEVMAQQTHRWATMVGPLPYAECVAIYTSSVLEPKFEMSEH